MMWNIDADPLDADWIKVRGWDLPTDPDKFLGAIGGRERLAAFMHLPAAQAMPQSLRLALVPGMPTDALLALRAIVGNEKRPPEASRGR